MLTPTRLLTAFALTGVLALTAACGSETDTKAPAETPTSSTPTSPATTPMDEMKHVEVTFKGDDVDPAGERVDLKKGQTLMLAITADAPGEIHVHSTPEQHVEYAAGDSTHEVKFDKPGVYEVESHDLDKLILQVQVR